MRKIRELLRLRFEAGLSLALIAQAIGMSKASVGEYLGRARAAGVSWPLPEALDDTALERRLFPPARHWRGEGPPRPEPNWAFVDRELRRKGVTRLLLWQEYRLEHPDGYGYAWFCETYETWRGRLSPTMRQHHGAGEKVFVDFAGDTVEVIDALTGAARPMKLFVAAMGASAYVFAQARASESLADWIGAHVSLFAYLGGAPRIVVCDNLKAAVTNPDRHEPGLNRTLSGDGRPLRRGRPAGAAAQATRQAKVEQSVLLAERWILARLRNQRFYSLEELNRAIAELTADLNAKIMRGYGASRSELFATVDAPALGDLPAEPYAFATWKRCRVAPDYHVEVAGYWYSVPFQLIRQLVDVRLTERTVEVFHNAARVASHVRSPGRRGHTTLPAHMPSSHRRHAEWTPARMMAAAQKIGPSTTALFDAVMAERPHPEQGFRTCLGVLELNKTYGAERLEAACRRALSINARSVASVRSILKSGLDRAFLDAEPEPSPLHHANIRGRTYYH